MADTQTLIDNGLMDEEGVASGDLSIPDVLQLRHRYKRNLQREGDFLWNYRDWPWKQDSVLVTVSLPAYNPADLYSFSAVMPDGQLLGRSAAPQLANQPGLPPLQWVPQATMNYLLMTEKRRGTPNRYSIFTENSSGDKIIYLYPLADVATDIVVTNELTPPVFHDAGDPADTAADEMARFPVQYHDAVLYEGMVLRCMKDKASAAYQQQLALYKLNIKNMVIMERPGRESPHRLLPYGVSARGRMR